jgi:hypothetical protein
MAGKGPVSIQAYLRAFRSLYPALTGMTGRFQDERDISRRSIDSFRRNPLSKDGGKDPPVPVLFFIKKESVLTLRMAQGKPLR